MAQGDYLIQNQSFPSFRSDLNSTLEAINTSNSGTSRPTSAVAGTVWLDVTNATNPTLKFFDGTDDISLATLDYTANTVNWLDSTVSADVVGDTTPQLGGNLDVNGNSIVSVSNGNITFTPDGTGKVIIDGLSHPTADGTSGQNIITDGAGNLSFSNVIPADNTVSLAKLTATGTKDATTFLRGDNTFAEAGGGVNTPSFSAERSGAQTISNETRTTILFNNEFYDSSSAYDTSTGKFTPQTAGKYFITASVICDGLTDSNLKLGFIELYKNATFITESIQNGAGTNAAKKASCTISCILDMNGSSDFLLIQAYISVHSSSPTVGDTSTFSAFRIIE